MDKQPAKSGTTTKEQTTESGPQESKPQTGQKGAGLADEALTALLDEQGSIRIAFTDTPRGMSLEWCSVRPVMSLSRFLQAVATERSATKVLGDALSTLSGYTDKDQPMRCPSCNEVLAKGYEAEHLFMCPKYLKGGNIKDYKGN
jgi:hypothetical protein